MAEHEDIVTDDLFVGLTRPATIFGIPYFASVIELMGIGIVFLASGNPLWLALAIPSHAVLYLISASNPAAFANIFAWLQSAGRCLNRSFWGAASFSPATVKKWQK